MGFLAFCVWTSGCTSESLRATELPQRCYFSSLMSARAHHYFVYQPKAGSPGDLVCSRSAEILELAQEKCAVRVPHFIRNLERTQGQQYVGLLFENEGLSVPVRVPAGCMCLFYLSAADAEL